MAKNPLSSLSYTNKDFNSIYVELLDIVKQLTHKWDPSISNESDPGVILLKLDAIIGDKNNYNIDKNILEAFPESVTQEVNARNAYKQLAYKMPWYQSATTTITMRWVGDELKDGIKVKIPRYTMLTNSDASVIYTLIDEPVFTNTNMVINARIMEGTVVTHTVNNNPVIDISNLDMSNRIFLNDYSVAENGIFITNSNAASSATWQQVDNLQVKTLGNKFYEFGVDSRNNYCYVEFPTDIDALIETGLNIKYLVSSGREGNISAKTLDQFYEETSIDVAGQSVVLSTDIVELYNASAAVDGANPQELDDAFKTYRKTAGTFNTLVTLRDYINTIYTSGLISNGYVCDRNTDIQSTYTVVTDDLVNPTYTYITESVPQLVKPNLENTYDGAEEVSALIDAAWTAIQDANAAPDLTAFDLRMYVLKNTGSISDIAQFDSSFEMIPPKSSKLTEIEGYIQEQQCIAHDFKDILPNKICMLQNAYPLNIKIVPQSKLTTNQIDEVKLNIIKSFYNILNARAIDFGKEADYDIIYDAIYQSDERIKTAILDDFRYTTFAIYWDETAKQFKRIPINHLEDTDSNQVIVFSSKSDLAAWQNLTGAGRYAKSRAQRDAANFVYLPSDPNENIYYNTDKFIDTSGTPLRSYDIIKFDSIEEKFYFYSDKYTEFQRDVLIKSILAGRTPLLEATSDFSYGINHQYVDEAEVKKITTGLTIAPFCKGDQNVTKTLNINGKESEVPLPDLSNQNVPTVGSYTLQPNETVRFLAPSFITNKSFSNYVKFELVLEKGRTVLQTVNDEADVNDNTYYYMTLEDRVRCVYDTLYRLSQLHSNIANSIPQTTFEKVESNDSYDPESMYEIRNLLDTPVLFKASEHSGYLTDDKQKFNISNDSDVEIYKITTTESEDWKTGEFPSDQLATNFEAELRVIRYTNSELAAQLPTSITEYKSRKEKLLGLTGSMIQFKYGNVFLGYENQATANACCIDVFKSSSDASRNTGRQEYEIDLIKYEDTRDSVVEGSNYTFSGLLNDYCSKDDWVWILDDEFPNYCKKLTPNLDTLPVRMTATQELNKNDCVVYSAFYCNTITLKYSTIVYQISPDTDYKLRPNEQITFFWRKEDGEDTPYTYEHYVGIDPSEEDSTHKSPIIRANFQLEGKPQSQFVNLSESGEIKAGTPEFAVVAEMYGDQDLSGTKTIDLREMNQVILDRINGVVKKQNRYYFITKDVNNKKYQMKFQLTSNNASGDKSSDVISYRYTLDNEEFFIYTSLDSEEYEVLGAGTLIGVDVLRQDLRNFDSTYAEGSAHEEVILEVDAIESNKLFEGGLEVFADSCLDIDKTITMFCREQQIYTVAESNKLHLNITDETAFKEANEKLLQAVGDAGGTINRPFFCTWADTVVSGFSVSIEDTSGTHALPALDIADDADCRWVGRSYLNISTAAEEPQEIVGQYSDYVSKTKKSAQFVQYSKDGAVVTFPNRITERQDGSDLTMTDSVLLATSIVVDKVGGRDVDISYLDGTGESQDTNIYLYSINSNFNDGVYYQTRSDGCIEVNIRNVVSAREKEATNVPAQCIKLPEGTHIIKIENTSDVAQFTLSLGSSEDVSYTPQSKLGDKTNSQDSSFMYGYGTHYFKIDQDDDSLFLYLEFSGDSNNIPVSDVLIIYPTVRGTLNTLLFSSEQALDSGDSPKYEYLFHNASDEYNSEIIWSKITDLDLKSKFNYANIVSDEVLIEDPLISKSFFDTNHIYNNFTLSKAEIKLSKATGSSTQIVNNR